MLALGTVPCARFTCCYAGGAAPDSIRVGSACLRGEPAREAVNALESTIAGDAVFDAGVTARGGPARCVRKQSRTSKHQAPVYVEEKLLMATSRRLRWPRARQIEEGEGQ